MTDSVEVLLVRLPRVLSDIISGVLTAEPGVKVRLEETPRRDVTESVLEAAPDVAIVSSDSPDLHQRWDDLLGELPRLKILTIVDDGRLGFLYELRPCRVPLGEVSAQTLLDAVRTAKAVAR